MVQPYPVPTSCAVTLPVVAKQAGPQYWLEGQGIRAGLWLDGLVFAGRNKILWLLDQPVDQFTVAGQRLDAAAPPFRVEIGETTDQFGKPVWPSGLVFPTAGCWQLQARAGAQTLEATVYVYPYDCRPPELREPTPSATPAPCVAP